MNTAVAALDCVTEYAGSVIAGEVLACRLVRLACARHLGDLEDGPGRGLAWDLKAAQHAIGFVERFLCLAGGEHEGKPFLLAGWQKFILGSLFGWKGPDGFRRYRMAYVEVAKGNGKSPLAAAIGLYMLVADGEARAEVYAAATKREQAMILFRDAVAMREQSPSLARVLKPSGAKGREWNLAHLKSGSFFRPIASDDDGKTGQSGPRVHCGLIDEVHEHRTARVIDMMDAGTKGRRQALILEITNSGHDRASVCWQHHDYSLQLLDGRLTNDAWFAFICGLDPCASHQAEGKTQPVEGCPDCDDWRDEACWLKANPNLGVSVTPRYLREQVAKAQGIPSKEGIVKRLNFCWWTEGETQWLPADLWSRGAGRIDPASLAGRECYAGLDMASKVDVAALVLCFPNTPEPGHYTLLSRFWIPRSTAQGREQTDTLPYLVWEREGWINLTRGDVIDQDTIEEDIKRDALAYLIDHVKFDPWNAAQITTHLQEHGVKVEEFRQNIRSFNEPAKLLESLLKEGKLHHGSHPVLDWMAGNVTVLTDPSGNIRPVKPDHNNARKVDGIVAAVMALAGAMLAPDTTGGGCEYW